MEAKVISVYTQAWVDVGEYVCFLLKDQNLCRINPFIEAIRTETREMQKNAASEEGLIIIIRRFKIEKSIRVFSIPMIENRKISKITGRREAMSE